MKIPFAIKYAWNKVFWFFGNPIRSMFRFFVRPRIRGVKMLICYQDRFLLVRPNYGHRLWSVPGGKVERGEMYEEAAKRETMEEVGIILNSLTNIGEYSNSMDFAQHTVRCFLANVDSEEFAVDHIEIKEAQWFNLDSLPTDRVSRVDKIVTLYRQTLTQ